MDLVRPPSRLVVPTEGWVPPRDNSFDAEELEFLVWPCPSCGTLSQYSFHFAFERDRIAFRCPRCDIVEVKC